jgi:alkanesulfonate monooxygenase SsuD/methylene tetrahydromethanopterin reductase-like flavin-dependent oxidoreductase (luciferase family)
LADGWVPSFRGGFASIGEMTRRIDDQLAAAGRSPSELRRILNVAGTITERHREGPLRGPVDQWVDEIGELAVTYGFDTFIFSGEGEDQLERFAEEVVPRVRHDVATDT